MNACYVSDDWNVINLADILTVAKVRAWDDDEGNFQIELLYWNRKDALYVKYETLEERDGMFAKMQDKLTGL